MSDRWVGKAAILQPGKAENGKDTILLVPVPPAEHEPPAQAADGQLTLLSGHQ